MLGPYYRYRTWWDCLHRNVGDYIDCWGLTLYKLKIITVSSVLYLIFEYYYPAFVSKKYLIKILKSK